MLSHFVTVNILYLISDDVWHLLVIVWKNVYVAISSCWFTFHFFLPSIWFFKYQWNPSNHFIRGFQSVYFYISEIVWSRYFELHKINQCLNSKKKSIEMAKTTIVLVLLAQIVYGDRVYESECPAVDSLSDFDMEKVWIIIIITRTCL